MWYILMKVLVAATAGLMWCVLVTFLCMCMEHLFFKKVHKPGLTDKEIILIKEVLAGNISLPLVANDGLFVQCVDRIEHIFEQFIARSGRQAERMEKLSEKLVHPENGINGTGTYPFPLIGADDVEPELEPEEIFAQGLPLEEDLYPKIGELLYRTETEGKKDKAGKLLEARIHIIGLPDGSRYIFKKKMNCENVGDVLQVMLCFGSRESLLKIYGIGKISVDRLEAFMLGNDLIYLQGYTYKSGYEDPEAQEVLRENKKFPRIR
jgi:hypothetical protein